MLSNFLLILGVAILTLSLRSCRNGIAQKLSELGVLTTSFLIGWLATGFWWVGLFCSLSWLLLPWVEILTRVRKLTLPMEKNLRTKSAPNRESFPALPELTAEIEDEGFEHLEDCGWDWEDYQQFFRLFYKTADRTQCAICMIEQHGMAFYYLSLSSRGKDGKIWTTWNYPFSYSLKLVPHWQMNRLRGDRTFYELYSSHCEFLSRSGVEIDDLDLITPEEIQAEIQKDLRAQITHNITAGVLTQTDSGEVRYSWRGLFFIWTQFLRDLVRMW